MAVNRFERIFLHRAVVDDERALSILAKLDGLPVEIVQGVSQVIHTVQSLGDPIGRGKKMLFLSVHQGRMVSKCPGTSDHICCGYQVLDLMSNCPMDCSYCILQTYLNNPVVTIFANLPDLIDELESASRQASSTFLRVGPGELSDSLALDHLTRFSDELVRWFGDHRNSILELKTKSDRVHHLLDLRHGGHTVISWSLNAPSVISAEEHGTASLVERLRAAKMCQEAGYPIGLHFDPLIFKDSWESQYRNTVEKIFRFLDPKRVIWVSMGGLRFPPSLKPIVQERFPESRILLGELFPGKDGKLRYLEMIRVQMFRKMLSWFHDIDPNLFVYLCMETHQVWQAVYGWSPGTTAGLVEIFDRQCREFMRRSS